MAIRSLSENVAQAINDFDGIQSAIIEKGVEVPNETPTSQYAQKILEIKGGGADGYTVLINVSTNNFTSLDGSSVIVNGESYPLVGIADSISIKTTIGMALNISFSDKDEYITPNSITYTVTEDVVVKLFSPVYLYNRAFVDVETEIGQQITIGTETKTVTQSVTRFILMPNTAYTVSVNEKDGYIKPVNKNITTGTASSIINVSMPYVLDVAYVNFTLSASPIANISNQIVTVKQGNNIILSEAYGAQTPKKITLKSNQTYTFSVSELSTYNPPKDISVITGNPSSTVSAQIKYVQLTRYGYRVKKAEPDPYNRVEYLYDAVGKTPAKMNYETGEFEYGSWKPFLDDLVKPCMVNYDLTIRGELNPNDHAKYIDGTDSGITDFNTPANAMAVFKKWYQYIYEDATYEYYIICDIKLDENYTDYHCYNGLGQQDYMMLPMFGVSYDNTRLRSIANKSVKSGLDIPTELQLAEANGAGWYSMVYSKWIHRNIILTLISKCTNTQKSFGSGNTASSVKLKTGTLINKGMFYGYNSTDKDVKTLYCEMPWGNYIQRMAGAVTDENKNILVKLIPPYDINGIGYVKGGNINFMDGYFKTFKVSNSIGTVPNEFGASDTTYYCDMVRYATANGYFAYGGGNGNNDVCGAYYFASSNRSASSSIAGSLSA